ncbi:MAG: hypothetical protein RBS22_12770, partial [Spongiibacteraceae bacterium]|nr:hypothetical protein [Spongiibacteraceae bacterium]
MTATKNAATPATCVLKPLGIFAALLALGACGPGADSPAPSTAAAVPASHSPAADPVFRDPLRTAYFGE